MNPFDSWRAQEPGNGIGHDLLERYPGLPDVVNEAQEAARAGRQDVAYEVMVGTAYSAIEAGLSPVALELLRQFHSVVKMRSLSGEKRAWLLNAEGLALSQSGAIKDAERTLKRMRAIAVRLDDQHLVSTADLNLANLAHVRGDLDKAERLYQRSADAKLSLQDYRGLIQILLNLAGLAVDRDELDRAASILDLTKNVLGGWRDPQLRFSLALAQGHVAATLRDYTSAEHHFRRALTYARKTNDVLRELRALQNLGLALLDQDRVKQSLSWLRKAADLADRMGVVPFRGELQRALAIALHRAGKDAEARPHFLQAAALARELGDIHSWATLTADSGATAMMAGDLEGGIAALSQALRTFRELGDASWEARTLTNLLEAYATKGEPRQADGVTGQLLQLLPPEAHSARAAACDRAAQAWLASGESPERAVEYFDRALGEKTHYLSANSVASETALAGAELWEAAHDEAALRYFDQALSVFQRLGEDDNAFHTRNDRALLLAHLNRNEEAVEELEQCLAVALKRNDRVMELRASMNLGELMRRSAELDRSAQLLDRAVQLAAELDDETAHADALSNLGLVLVEQRRLDDAQTVFRSARDIAKRVRDRDAEAQAVRGLAQVPRLSGHDARAVRLFRRAAALWTDLGDIRHLCETYATLVECLSVLGRLGDLQEAGQHLVDSVQMLGDVELALHAFTSSAPLWLQRGDVETAAGLYAVSLALATFESSEETDAEPDAPGELDGEEMNAQLRDLVCMSAEMAVRVGALQAEAQEQFWVHLTESLDQWRGLGDALQPLLTTARDTAANVYSEHSGEVRTDE